MDKVMVGIDVAKAGLDVHVLPAGEAFAVARDAAGIDALIARLRPLKPMIVAVEATGGLESVVAASLGSAGLPVVVVNPAQVRAFAQAHDRGIGANGRKPIRSMRPGVGGGDRPVRSGHETGDPALGRCRDHGARRSNCPHPDVLGRQIIQMITAEASASSVPRRG